MPVVDQRLLKPIVKQGCSLRDQQKIAQRNLNQFKVSQESNFYPSQGCDGLPLNCYKHNGLIYRAQLNSRGKRHD